MPTTIAEIASAGMKLAHEGARVRGRFMPGGSLQIDRRLTMIPRLTPPRLAIVWSLSLALALSAVTRSPAHAQSSSPLIKDVSLFREGIGRVAWSAQGDWLAFDRRDPEHGNY